MYKYRCTVLRVVDGDTIDCNVDVGFHISITMRFRLAGINAPEMKTPNGPKAKARLMELMPVGYILSVDTNKDRKEKYGRYLGTFWNEDGVTINSIMIQEGFAVPYTA